MQDYIIQILNFLYNFTSNHGVSIILLTLAIRAVFWSLNTKQYESMSAMRKIQPKLKEIQQKHKSNPQLLQKEMMDLYKTHKVNPFSGCLPMLIQLPVLFILYAALNSTQFVELDPKGKGFLWIKDISFVETVNFNKFQQEQGGRSDARREALSALIEKDTKRYSGLNTAVSIPLGGQAAGIPLLALLVALTTFYSQKTMDIDPEQKKMMAFMPIMMLIICLNLSAGISIYLAVSNLLMALQQAYLKKKSASKPNTIDVKPLPQ